MVDYSKQTVAQLRQLLKERGIPSTGLQRKAQIIEKLEEADNVAQEAPEPAEAADANEDTRSVTFEQETSIPPATIEPAPEPVQTVEAPTEETVAPTEPPPTEPVTDNNAPPATEDAPAMTEVADFATQDKGKENADEEQADAPEPAVEAIPSAEQEMEVNTQQTDSVREDSVPSPALTEKPSIEKPEMLLAPERTTAETSRLNTEELEADSRKRKRRSDTPDIPTEDIKAKKHRPSGDVAPAVYLKEDVDVVMEQRQPEEDLPAEEDHTAVEQKDSPEEASEVKREKKENSSLYKDLMHTSTDDAPAEAVVDDRPTIPALHPVTSALYIRDFMRPLRPESLRTHLVSLASPPTGSPDASIVKSLFLDAMKTHALVSFTSTSAASRVRAALHGSIWPPEGNRKELWVDFIPSDRVSDWIQEEEDAVAAEKEARANGRSLAPKRFEIVYPESEDGSIVAVFQEVSSNPLATAPRRPSTTTTTKQPAIPTPSAPAAPSKDTRQDIEASFKTLDQLFRSTTAKPQLFYLPVSDEISDRRLKELDQETSRDWTPVEVRKGRGIKSDVKYKYSFSDEDWIVEVGEDRGPWTEFSEGYIRGGRGGGGGYRGRGGGRGGYRGRGGGESWRG